MHVVTGDLAEQEVCIAAFETRPTAVVHLAALTSVLRSVDAPMQTFAQNVTITQVLLELSRGSGVDRFVLASTNACLLGDVGYVDHHRGPPAPGHSRRTARPRRRARCCCRPTSG